MATDLLTEAVVGEGVTLREITWETYLDLRDNPENDQVRMTYLDGTLILMSPEIVHDNDAELLGVLIRATAKAIGLEVMGTRSTTLRRGRARRGAAKEPETSFYIGNERRMRRKKTLDLTVDPPPDLAVEVDNKSDSKAALPIYARLGVPEVWRYTPTDEVAMRFYRLEGEGYEEVDQSVALPVLTSALVLELLRALDESEMGEIAWSDHIVDRIRQIAAEPRD